MIVILTEPVFRDRLQPVRFKLCHVGKVRKVNEVGVAANEDQKHT